MIIYRNKFLRIARVWFDESPPEKNVDIVYYSQWQAPVPGSTWQEFRTIIIDLRQPEDALFASFKKDTRYEIRRALKKDRVVCEKPSQSDLLSLEQFCEFYERFAAQKHRANADRKMLSFLSDSGNLYVSCAKALAGEQPVFHAYYYCASRVRLLYSASLFRGTIDTEQRNLVGRMNRCLHWNDMISFKRDGIPMYDFGGWYDGADDEEKLRINKFKEEFGGVIVKNYNCAQGVTLKGKVALLINRYLRNR